MTGNDVSKGYPYGGIYCVIPLGKIYDESIRKSAHRRFYRLFAKDAEILREMTLNNGIIYEIKKLINGEMASQKYQTYDQMSAPSFNTDKMTPNEVRRAYAQRNRFRNLIKEVTESYGYAVYHNGVRVYYSKAPFSGGGAGQERIKDFFDENKNKLPGIGSRGGGNTNNWNVVIAVAHYVAARFEAHGAYPDNMYRGYGKRVLLVWAQVIANAIRASFGRVNTPVRYGYILSRKGYEGRVYSSGDIVVG